MAQGNNNNMALGNDNHSDDTSSSEDDSDDPDEVERLLCHASWDIKRSIQERVNAEKALRETRRLLKSIRKK